MTVTNDGPSDASGVTLSDTLPGGVTFVSATSTSGTCGESGGVVSCNTIGTLTNGASATITITVTVPTSMAHGTILSNSATSTATETDPNTANNTNITQTTTVNREADLAVTKSDSPDPVLAGNNLTYTVTVTNDGPSDASGVTLSDTLPGGVTFVSATSTAGTCGESGGVVSCNSIGTLTNGASATITITVTVPTSMAHGTILSNSATATATETDPNTSNNTNITQNTTVNREADLAVTKSDSPDPVFAGNNLTYTVTVTNDGPSDASGVTLSDTLPGGVTFVSATSTAGTCGESGGVVSCNSIGSPGQRCQRQRYHHGDRPNLDGAWDHPEQQCHLDSHGNRSQHRQQHQHHAEHHCPASGRPSGHQELSHAELFPRPALDVHSYGDQQRPRYCDRRRSQRHAATRSHVRIDHAGLAYLYRVRGRRDLWPWQPCCR